MTLHSCRKTSGSPATIQLSGPLIAIAVSIAFHVLLILVLRQSPSPQASPLAPFPALIVQLLPAEPFLTTPSPQPTPVPSATINRPLPSMKAARDHGKPASTSTVTGMPSAPRKAPQEEQKKRIDMDGIRQNLGAIIGDIDREKDGSAVGQLRTRPRQALSSEQGLSREVARSGRPDCMLPNSLPGGLLAPIFLLMEKKGSGCKL